MPVQLTLDELADARDLDLGASEWFEVTQEQIDTFADATHDHQWIHVDPEKAKEGPFGTTIAHGYLTVSMIPHLIEPLLEVKGAQMGVNYGIDRMRLTAPVPVGSRIRAKATIKDARGRGEQGIMYRVSLEVEIEGGEKPALVGDVVYVVYG